MPKIETQDEFQVQECIKLCLAENGGLRGYLLVQLHHALNAVEAVNKELYDQLGSALYHDD
jgi:hypothetical protein